MRPRDIWLVVALAASAAWLVALGLGRGEGPGAYSELVNGAPVITVLPRDAIPAIDDPKFVSATEGDRVMSPDEPVLGVTDCRVAKAYSLWQLNHHEIVNDRIETLPVAVTW